MEQKKMRLFKDKLLQKKQEILEAYTKNKAYGNGGGRRRRPGHRRQGEQLLREGVPVQPLEHRARDAAAGRRGARAHRRAQLRLLRRRARARWRRSGSRRCPGRSTASPARRSRNRACCERALGPRWRRDRALGLEWAALSRSVLEPAVGRGVSVALLLLPAAARAPARGPLCDGLLGAAAAPPVPALRLRRAAAAAAGRAMRPLPARPGRVRARRTASAPTKAPCARWCTSSSTARAAGASPLGWRSASAPTRAVAAVLAPRAVLVPVPLHPRRRQRARLQPGRAAGASSAGAPRLRVAPRALVRRCDTPAQTGLSAPRAAAQRRGRVRRAPAARGARTDVVLVDDVLTTGATGLRLRPRAAAARARASVRVLDGRARRVSGAPRREGCAVLTGVVTGDGGRALHPRRALGGAGARLPGPVAHQAVTPKAIDTLPKRAARSFYKNHRLEMPTLSPDASRPDEGPERRFAVDRLLPFPFPDLPRSEATLKAQFPDAAGKAGRLPWLIQEGYDAPGRGLPLRRQDSHPGRVRHARRAGHRHPEPAGPDRQRRRPEDRPARALGALRRPPAGGDGAPAEAQRRSGALPRRSQGVRLLDGQRRPTSGSTTSSTRRAWPSAASRATRRSTTRRSSSAPADLCAHRLGRGRRATSPATGTRPGPPRAKPELEVSR